MASEISTGMMKIMKKMDEAVNTGNYYEALQMYRSLNSRYTAQNNFSGLIEILYKGAQKVLTKNEEEIGLDLLDLLLTALTAELAHLKAIAKDKKRNFEDYKDPFIRDWIIKLKDLLRFVHGGHPIREELIAKIVRWSGEGHDPGHPSVHKAIAQLYKSEKNYACAFQHFFKASNGSDLASFLIEYQQNLGYKYEEDLFIANIVLNYLSNKNIEFASITFNKYTNDHPKIREKEPPFLLPLLNFLWFLIKTLERPEPAVKQFVVLCDIYEPSINRDPSYQDYLDKIALLYYGIKKPKPLNTGGGGIGELLMNAYREISINEPESVSSATLRHVRDNADVD